MAKNSESISSAAQVGWKMAKLQLIGFSFCFLLIIFSVLCAAPAPRPACAAPPAPPARTLPRRASCTPSCCWWAPFWVQLHSPLGCKIL